jgi:hypothetical protein
VGRAKWDDERSTLITGNVLSKGHRGRHNRGTSSGSGVLEKHYRAIKEN